MFFYLTLFINSKKSYLLLTSGIYVHYEEYKMGNCPYCKQKVSLKEVKTEIIGTGFIGQEKMYICPHCENILGFSNRQR